MLSHKEFQNLLYYTLILDGDVHMINKLVHRNLQVCENGLFIDVVRPYLGASPDSLISCSCCGNGILEIKCPHCCKFGFPDDEEEAQLMSSFCMTRVDGSWCLKKEHSYYYQIQAQMYVCQQYYCDFVVWSQEAGVIIQRLEYNADFFNSIIDDLQHFFIYGVLPEVVGKWYTRKPVANSDKIVMQPTPDPDDELDDTEDYEKNWCYCRQPVYGEMIFCENPNCRIEWFHCDCLWIRKPPKGSWRCQSCRKLPKQKK